MTSRDGLTVTADLKLYSGLGLYSGKLYSGGKENCILGGIPLGSNKRVGHVSMIRNVILYEILT